MKYFYKLITCYMIDYNHSTNLGNIRRQFVGYSCPWRRNEKWNSRHTAMRRINMVSSSTTCYHPILIFCDLILTRNVVCWMPMNTTTNYGVWLDEKMNLRSHNGRGSIKKYVIRSYVHEWYRGNWLATQTLGEPGPLLDLVYAPSSGMSDNVGSTTSFFSIHQWWYTLDRMITYVSLYTQVCYLHNRRNNRMEKFHWTMPH